MRQIRMNKVTIMNDGYVTEVESLGLYESIHEAIEASKIPREEWLINWTCEFFELYHIGNDESYSIIEIVGPEPDPDDQAFTELDAIGIDWAKVKAKVEESGHQVMPLSVYYEQSLIDQKTETLYTRIVELEKQVAELSEELVDSFNRRSQALEKVIAIRRIAEQYGYSEMNRILNICHGESGWKNEQTTEPQDSVLKEENRALRGQVVTLTTRLEYKEKSDQQKAEKLEAIQRIAEQHSYNTRDMNRVLNICHEWADWEKELD